MLSVEFVGIYDKNVTRTVKWCIHSFMGIVSRSPVHLRWPMSRHWMAGLANIKSPYCSGSLEPESSCHDRDWIMELPMEADILTFTGILTPEDASVASCFPFDITISLSRSGPFSSVYLHYTPLYHRGRETSRCPGRHFSTPENTNASWRLPNLYPDSYDWGLPDHRLVDWPHGLTSLDRPRGLAGGRRSGHELLPRINKQKAIKYEA